VASEALSKIIDWTDRNTCVIFADGAGAAVLGPSDGKGAILASFLGSDGSGADLVGVPAGGSRIPATIESVKKRQHFMKMKGNELFKRAVKIMVEASETVLTEAGLGYHDIDFFVPHQANIRIIQAVTKRIHLPEDKVYINLQECGNMSAASIAVALDQAQEEGKIHEGSKILLTSFGGGLTWGSMVIQW
jgi:3-oxoacyl-[acyl-carrier-protein] synthase-3